MDLWEPGGVNWENQKERFIPMKRKFGQRKVQVMKVMIARTNFTYFIVLTDVTPEPMKHFFFLIQKIWIIHVCQKNEISFQGHQKMQDWGYFIH